MRFIRKLISVLFLGIVSYLHSQDIGGITKQKAFDFSGSLSFNANFYNTSRETSNRDPFSYLISGSPNISIYGINIPLSFSYSNQEFTTSKPFQRYGASPYYKWVKLHLGHRSIELSPYVMMGQTFLGVGLELSPGKFRFVAFYGTFENIFSQTDPFISEETPTETFKRKVQGLKLGYEGDKSGFNLSVLKVKDEQESSNLSVTEDLNINPQENIVFSPHLYFTLFKRLSIQGRAAASVITLNQNANSGLIDSDIVNDFSSFIEINHSTKISFAGDASVALDFDNVNFGVKYKRVEPLYQSLGLFGITNDFENYTINTQISLFKQRLQVRLSQGFQKNNLRRLEKVTDTRRIGSYNLSLNLKKGFNINAQYTNFQSDQEAGFVEINDSIRLALTNSNASINSSYRWKRKKSQHSISVSASTQSFKDLNPRDSILSLENQSTSVNLGYRIKLKEKNLSFRSGINYTTYENSSQQTSRTGLSLSMIKKLANKKLNLHAGFSIKKSTVNNEDDGFVTKGRLGLSYKLGKRSSLFIRTSLINRDSDIREAFTDYRGSFGYTFKL